MHVISKRRIRAFLEVYPDASTSLLAWLHMAEHSTWRHLVEVQGVWPSADLVGSFVVFNIAGNKYRLIVYIDYAMRKIFIRHILTHSDYDKETWKHDDWYQ